MESEWTPEVAKNEGIEYNPNKGPDPNTGKEGPFFDAEWGKAQVALGKYEALKAFGGIDDDARYVGAGANKPNRKRKADSIELDSPVIGTYIDDRPFYGAKWELLYGDLSMAKVLKDGLDLNSRAAKYERQKAEQISSAVGNCKVLV